ncbi:MAG: alpha/beta fold hydrolase [Burkholderiaceae bacterium]|nr:alpha/beta fold hydrolase [Microbacteriaceae bacterium]
MSMLVPIPSPGIALEYGVRGRPLVVMLHDWFGRLPSLQAYATALVGRGFHVVVPDLYGGVATTDESAAQRLLDQLDIGMTLEVIDDLVRTGRENGSPRVGLIGFSMGGWLALLHAQGGAVDAVTAYCASLDHSDHGVIPCSVQLHLAEVDTWEREAEPDRFVERLEDHGTPVSIFTYAGTRHGFANGTIHANVDEQASALAYARTAKFLEFHLLD